MKHQYKCLIFHMTASIKKQIRVESSLPCTVRYTRVTANKSPSVFMRTEKKINKKSHTRTENFCSIIHYSLKYQPKPHPTLQCVFSSVLCRVTAQCLKTLLLHGAGKGRGAPNSSDGLRLTWDRCCCMTCHFHSPTENLSKYSRIHLTNTKAKCHVLEKNALFRIYYYIRKS